MPKTISCPHAGCTYLFSKPVHLRRHLLSHSDESVWKCPDCDQEFKRIDSFQRHKKRIHPDQPDLVAVKIDSDSSNQDKDTKSDADAEDQIDHELHASLPHAETNTNTNASASPAIPVALQQLNAYDANSNPSPSTNTTRSSAAFSPSTSDARPSASSSSTYHRSHLYHPYARNDHGSQSASSAPAHSSTSDPSSITHTSWQPQSNQPQIFDSTPHPSATASTATPSSSLSFYPNLYGAPISYNDYATAAPAAAAAAVAYAQPASADHAAPLSIP